MKYCDGTIGGFQELLSRNLYKTFKSIFDFSFVLDFGFNKRHYLWFFEFL